MKISKLHIISTASMYSSHVDFTEMACSGGADWIQFRIKNKKPHEILNIGERIKILCDYFGAKLIINDHVHIAKKLKTHGVHLGKEDISVTEARNILGKKYIIGGTANTEEDVKKLISEGADYIGLGPFRFTTTKENLSPILGLEGIRQIAVAYSNQIPIIAIGGITLSDIEPLLDTGIHGIATSSAIADASNPEQTTQTFISSIKKYTDGSVAYSR